MNNTTTTAPFTSPLLLDTKGGMPVLALRPREAAKAIGISERTLWTMTQRGDIPHVRLDRAILYPVDGLRSWLSQRSEGRAQP